MKTKEPRFYTLHIKTDSAKRIVRYMHKRMVETRDEAINDALDQIELVDTILAQIQDNKITPMDAIEQLTKNFKKND
jgi:hypothetical protein